MSIVLDGLIFIIGWAHVILAPYTKVEESFNLHATHDLLMWGPPSNTLHYYDHFTFPGAVPRTFVGSVLLSWLSEPVIALASRKGLVRAKPDLQIIARLVLASANAFGLCLIRRAVSRRFGRLSGLLFALLTVTQFHLPFWMGRTLPNMFALLPVNIATSLLIDRAPNKTKPSDRSITAAVALLTFTTVVFRAEVLLLLAPLVLQSLLHRHITLPKVVKVGLISGLLSLTLTVVVDSYFWDQAYLWPELAGLYFNVYLGKSSEWGTSPRLAYWTSHLPKLLLSALPLSIVGFLLDQRIRDLLFPFLAFIGLITFNVAAARGARWLVSRPKSTLLGRLLFLAVPACLGLNIALTGLLTLTSMNNYPGGEALVLFHQLYPQFPRAHVHISNLAAQTGASIFLHLRAGPLAPVAVVYSRGDDYRDLWTYNKTESLTIDDLTGNKAITHLITETRPNADMECHWKVVAGVKGFERWEVDWTALKFRPGEWTREKLANVLKMRKEEKLWILERI
ncbi:putative alg9-like mannosyltransferase family protein [Lyophyllum shimeji]|uniref:Mannosyltransferase n=1 Tax=Lyophyllum shimeji TaxID=47721 RepID=A0A9P3UPY2_LYOSH|nr:putative alg9-like mannosyltransferase family protein [Lyophyllum shimeji]